MPPPFTKGIHDFLGAAAATTSNLWDAPLTADLPPMAAFKRVRPALEPERKGVDRPWTTTADVEAIALLLLVIKPVRLGLFNLKRGVRFYVIWM